MTAGKPLLCPLYEREISTGKCLDINYERLKYTQLDDLKDLRKIGKKKIEELISICRQCPNQPFPNDEVGKVITRTVSD